MTADEPRVERRITYEFGVNKDQKLTGFASYADLVIEAIRRTEGPVTVTKREERLVTYTEWEPEVTDEEYVRPLPRGGWLLSDKAVADIQAASNG